MNFRFNSYGENYWVCDFETITGDTQFFNTHKRTRVWLAYAKRFHSKGEPIDNEEILEIDIDSFFNAFFRKGNSATLFFHNLSWDGEFIKWYLEENNFRYFTELPSKDEYHGKCYTLMEDKTGIFFIRIRKYVKLKGKVKSVNLYIRCSQKLLTVGIDALAKIFKLPPKLEINYNVEPYDHINEVPQIYIDYIKRDVEIMIIPLQQYNEVFKVVYSKEIKKRNPKHIKVKGRYVLNPDYDPYFKPYTRDVDVWGFSKITISSTAMHLFKYHTRGEINFNDAFKLPYALVNELIPFYRGGLTVFAPRFHYKLTDTPNGKLYDVNSMYPSVMVGCKYPIGIPSKIKKSDEYDIHMVKVMILKAKIKNPQWPHLLPYTKICMEYAPKSDITPRYVSYVEMGTYYFFADELESLKRFYDIEYNIIDNWYFKSKDYFKEFISKYYNMRLLAKQNGDSREQMYKLLLNSAYGKFGQKPDRETILYSYDNLDYCDLLYVGKKKMVINTIRNDDSKVLGLNSYIVSPQEPPKQHTNVAIAACVTKNARLKLYDAIYNNIDNFIYCDTDSVFLTEEAKGIEIDKSKLGAWDLEATFNKIEVGGAKLYTIYLNEEVVKRANAGINKRWAKDNLKPLDVITVGKELGLGSKLKRTKVVGGLILEEVAYTIKKRG